MLYFLRRSGDDIVLNEIVIMLLMWCLLVIGVKCFKMKWCKKI